MTEDLVQGLALWRRTRHPHVAHVVVAMGRQAPCPFRRRSFTDNEQRSWIQYVRSGLVEHVTALCDTLPNARRLDLGIERIEALFALGPDPRVAAAARQWALQLPYRTRPRNEPFWARALEILAAWSPRDTDFVELAREVRRRHPTRFGPILAERLESLTSTAPEPEPLDVESQQWLDGCLDRWPLPGRTRPATDARTIASLLQAIAEDPDEDANRQVLADLVRQSDAPPPWATPVFLEHAQPVLDEWGLPATAVAGAGFRSTLGEIGWRLVRELRVRRGWVKPGALKKLLTHPDLRGLRRLINATIPDLASLGGHGLRSVKVVRTSPRRPPLWDELGEVLARLPRLQRLELPFDSDQVHLVHHLRVPELDFSGGRGLLSGRVALLLPGLSEEVRQVKLLTLLLRRGEEGSWHLEPAERTDFDQSLLRMLQPHLG